MPEEPIPEQDPVVTKSYAMWYVVCMVILMATLFWALWDEAVGQRPWKAYQRTWQDRYTAFLHVERKKAEQNPRDYKTVLNINSCKPQPMRQMRRPNRAVTNSRNRSPA